MKKLKGIGLIIAAALLLVIGIPGFNIFKGLKVQKICENIRDGNTDTAIAELEKYSNLDITPGPVLLKLADLGEMRISPSPLHAACSYSDNTVITYLIERGADPNFTAETWSYPLEAYCTEGYEPLDDMLEYLVDHGADPNLYAYTPPVFELTERLAHMDEKYIQATTEDILYLLDNGAQITATSRKYHDITLFHMCAYQDNTELLRKLLGREETLQYLDVKDDDGKTAYDEAVERGYTECAELLKEASEKQ